MALLHLPAKLAGLMGLWRTAWSAAALRPFPVGNGRLNPRRRSQSTQSAVIIEAWRDNVAACLMLWYPGMEGGHALVDVLLGRVNPSGKLPCTFPRRAEDLPYFGKDATKITYGLWHGYRKLERDGAALAFPFGFGLSYTTFALDHLRLAQETIGAEGALVATVPGDRTGEEVVQCRLTAKLSRPPASVPQAHEASHRSSWLGGRLSQDSPITSDAQYSRREAIFPSTNSRSAISFMCLRLCCTTSSKYTSHSAMPVVPSMYALSRVKLM
jgi:hypothetical protein